MKVVWTATAIGQTLLTAYAEGEEIPAAIAQALPSEMVTCETVSSAPTEPTEPGPYLINGAAVAVLLPRGNGDKSGWDQGYRWTRPGSDGRHRWDAVYNWDTVTPRDEVTVVRLVPQRQTVAEITLPWHTSAPRPRYGATQHKVLVDSGRGVQGRHYCSYLSIAGEGAWLNEEQTSEAHAALGRALDEWRSR